MDWYRSLGRNGAAESIKIDFSESYDTASLKGRSALITGGSTGIGAAITEALAEAGVYVTIADINEKDGSQLAKDLTTKGKSAQFVKTDVTSWDSQTAAFKAALDFSPSKTIDIVIPCAGIGDLSSRNWVRDTPTEPLPPPTKVLDVNLIGVYHTAHLALWAFKNYPGSDASWSKHVVFVASMAGYLSMPLVMDYACSKWGVRGLFRALRGAPGVLGEGKPAVRFNLIAPTWVRTPLTASVIDRIEKMGRIVAEPSDAAWVVMRMCADQKVIGRAATVAAERKGFDICDDAEGLDAGRELHDKHNRHILNLDRSFGGQQAKGQSTE